MRPLSLKGKSICSSRCGGKRSCSSHWLDRVGGSITLVIGVSFIYTSGGVPGSIFASISWSSAIQPGRSTYSAPWRGRIHLLHLMEKWQPFCLIGPLTQPKGENRSTHSSCWRGDTHHAFHLIDAPKRELSFHRIDSPSPSDRDNRCT